MYTAVPLCLELIQPLAELKSLNHQQKEGSSQISLCLHLISPPKRIKIALRERHLELSVCLPAFIFLPQPRSEHMTL